MKIGFTYDLRDDYLAEGYTREATAEFDSIETIFAIEQTLTELGHFVDRIGNVKRLISRLAAGDRWDMVFNIAEGMDGFGREAQIPAILDAYNIPYTFSDPLVLTLTLHKGMTKHVLRSLGIPTPDFMIVETIDDVSRCRMPYPLFVKPVAEGTSKGIDGNSLIQSPEMLRAVCLNRLQQFNQPVLVERYLSGPEYTVGLLGTGTSARAVGAMEVIFQAETDSDIYSLENKEQWANRVTYRLLTGKTARQAKTIALKTWKALGCRDAGRVDLRLDEYGNLYVLEVNPLAGLRPKYSDLPILCELSGISYISLLEQILTSANVRMKPVAAVA